MRECFEQSQKRFAQAGFFLDPPPVYRPFYEPPLTPVDSTHDYVQASRLAPSLIVRDDHQHLQEDCSADQVPVDRLNIYKTRFDNSQEIYSLLRKARLRNQTQLGGLDNARVETLIFLALSGALYRMEAGDCDQAADLLLDAWSLYRVRAMNWDVQYQSRIQARSGYFNFEQLKSLTLCTRRLGTRLSPGDAAKLKVQQLINLLVDESYLKPACTLYLSRKLKDINADRVFSADYPLLTPLMNRHYASRVDLALNTLSPIDEGRFNLFSLAQFEPKESPLKHDDRSIVFLGSNVYGENELILTTDLQANRLTALALACHLYRLDHGAWPTPLDRLYPQYLPFNPNSRYAMESNPIQIVKVINPQSKERIVLINVDDQSRFSLFFYSSTLPYTNGTLHADLTLDPVIQPPQEIIPLKP